MLHDCFLGSHKIIRVTIQLHRVGFSFECSERLLLLGEGDITGGFIAGGWGWMVLSRSNLTFLDAE